MQQGLVPRSLSEAKQKFESCASSRAVALTPRLLTQFPVLATAGLPGRSADLSIPKRRILKVFGSFRFLECVRVMR